MTSFTMLKSMVDQLSDHGLPEDDKEQIIHCIAENQRYVHTFFKYHLSWNSECIYHCLSHALSDGTKAFTKKCHHDHSTEHDCHYCQILANIVAAMDQLLETYRESLGERTYKQWSLDLRKSYSKILEYKYHLMRSFCQTSAWEKLIAESDGKTVFVIMDWAMKM